MIPRPGGSRYNKYFAAINAPGTDGIAGLLWRTPLSRACEGPGGFYTKRTDRPIRPLKFSIRLLGSTGQVIGPVLDRDLQAVYYE